MKSKKKPNNAIFYGNYKELIYNGTPEQVKAIMTAFCQYAFDGLTPKVSPDISLAWEIMKGNIEVDFKKYGERCEQNSVNALKRYSDTVVYTLDGQEYELTFPKKHKKNIISEIDFQSLFGEFEDEPDTRHRYIQNFMDKGNNDMWAKPYEKYCQELWEEIFKGTV